MRALSASRSKRPSSLRALIKKISSSPTSRTYEMLWTWMRFVAPGSVGVDPLGGAARPYWEPINEIYHLDIAS